MIKQDDVKLNLNKTTGLFMPEFEFTKALSSASDAKGDINYNYTSNYSVVWWMKDKDGEKMGSGAGFYLDDPMNPVISGAKTLAAGALTAGALAYATLA